MKFAFYKVLSMFLSLLLLLSCLSSLPVSADSPTQGKMSSGVVWSYDRNTKTLSFTGEGEIVSYKVQSDIPWWEFRNEIQKVFVGEGITTVYSLEELSKLKSVSLPSTVTDIGSSAFYNCTALETVNLPKNINYVSNIAFVGCCSLLNFTIDNDLNGHGNAFVGNGGNKTIRGSGNGYFVKNGVLFSNYDEHLTSEGYFKKINHNRLEIYPYGRADSHYVVPSDTMVIMQDAFSSVKHLQTIVIPASVRRLHSLSFRTFGETYEHAITVVFQHKNYPAEMSYSVFRNLIEGSKIIVKNKAIKTEFNEHYDYFIYHSDGKQTVTIEAQPTPTTSLQLNQTEISLNINETSVIEPSQTPYNTTDDITFTSSDNDVVSFDNYGFGRITAIGVGTATVTVTSGTVSAQCTVTVTCNHVSTSLINERKATCTKDGYTGDSVCDECKTVVNKGSAITAPGHIFVQADSKEATCTTAGYVGELKCSVCNTIKNYIKPINALGHKYVLQSTKASTCNQEGHNLYTCTQCGDNKTEVLAKTSHTWDVGEVAKAATCNSTGITVKTCTTCKETKSESIAKTTAHKVVIDKAVNPTCTKTGKTAGSHCSVCQKVIKAQKIVAKLSHKTKTIGKKSATYFAKGSTGKKICTVCNKTISKAKSIAKKVLKKPSVTIKAGKRIITVKYKNVSGATGFQIRYRQSGKKSWTVKTYTSKKTVTKTLKFLKKGKNYNVQVRALVKKGSQKAYSKWSNVKTVKVK